MPRWTKRSAARPPWCGEFCDDSTGVGIDVPFWGFVSHHRNKYISAGDDIPNSWVMFSWDIYQPLGEGWEGCEEVSGSGDDEGFYLR